MKFTIEIHKQDRRVKSGERLIGKYDFDRADREAMQREVKELYPLYTKADGYRIEIRETHREVTNFITGKTTLERYDTPYACSVASEAYWSN